MKKFIPLGCGLLVLSVTTFAQSVVFYRGNAPLANNAEVTISKTTHDEFGALTIESGLSAKNTTDYTVPASLRRTILTSPSEETGAFLSTCFGNCVYDDFKNSTFPPRPQDEMMEANALVESPQFHLSLILVEGNYTVAKVKYEIYPTENPEDVSTVTITYDYNERSGLDNIKENRNDLIAFQEGNRLIFKYAFDEKNIRLEIFDIVGNTVGEYPLASDGLFTLPEALKPGIYIYTVKTNGKQLVTNKLIIK
ncbi:MAG: T9SS type A sorting domain-containing protein [Dysgonamonadaceae bacterium]|jgi:hypothetical protein|nr:T9SS type A sorting domain-containing protein [Dysgonamonadaceae bacterium]